MSRRVRPAAFVQYAAGLLLFFLVWWGGSLLAGPRVLPPPGRVLLYLASPSVLLDFAAEVLRTIGRGLLGFSVAWAVAIPAGLLMGRRRSRERVGFFPLILLQSAPPLFWIMPLILWIGTDGLVASVVAFLISLPLLTAHVTAAIRHIPEHAFDVFRIYAPYPTVIARELYLPRLIPAIRSNMQLGFLLSVKGAMLAEWFAAQNGFGRRIQMFYQFFSLTEFVGWAFLFLLVVAGLSLALRSLLDRALPEYRQTPGSAQARDAADAGRSAPQVASPPGSAVTPGGAGSPAPAATRAPAVSPGGAGAAQAASPPGSAVTPGGAGAPAPAATRAPAGSPGIASPPAVAGSPAIAGSPAVAGSQGIASPPATAGSPAGGTELEARDLSFGYEPGAPLFRSVSFCVTGEQPLVLHGRSGCGKTTLLKIVAGLLEPWEGDVKTPGRPALLFQEDALLEHRDAIGNVLLPSLRRFGEEEVVAARGALALWGLGGLEERFPHELSGGMRKRLSMARAWYHEPRVLLLDEPFVNLDKEAREALWDTFFARIETMSIPTVIVTHYPEELDRFGAKLVAWEELGSKQLGARDRAVRGT